MLKQSLFLIIFILQSLAVPVGVALDLENCRSEYSHEKKTPINLDILEEWEEEEDNKTKWLPFNCNFNSVWIIKSLSEFNNSIDTIIRTRTLFINNTSLIIWIQNFRI